MQGEFDKNDAKHNPEADNSNEDKEHEAMDLLLNVPPSVLCDEEKAILMIVFVLDRAKSFEEFCDALHLNVNDGFRIMKMMEDCGAVTIQADGTWESRYKIATVEDFTPEMVRLCGEGVCDLTKEDEDFVKRILL